MDAVGFAAAVLQLTGLALQINDLRSRIQRAPLKVRHAARVIKSLGDKYRSLFFKGSAFWGSKQVSGILKPIFSQCFHLIGNEPQDRCRCSSKRAGS